MRAGCLHKETHSDGGCGWGRSRCPHGLWLGSPAEPWETMHGLCPLCFFMGLLGWRGGGGGKGQKKKKAMTNELEEKEKLCEQPQSHPGPCIPTGGTGTWEPKALPSLTELLGTAILHGADTLCLGLQISAAPQEWRGQGEQPVATVLHEVPSMPPPNAAGLCPDPKCGTVGSKGWQ